MHSSSKQEQLRQLLKEQHAFLQQTFSPDRYHTLLALIRVSNWHYLETQHNNTACHLSLSMLSLQKALSLCFSTQNTQTSPPPDTLDTWADSTLQACNRLAEAERILAYCDTGFMRMQQGNDTDYAVWVASKKMPTEWREHEDLVWWTNLLKQTYATEMHMLHTEKAHMQQQLALFMEQWDGQVQNVYTTTQTIDDYYYRLGMLYVKMMVSYNAYPASVTIGGCTFAEYCDVLGVLIGYAIKHSDLCRTVLEHHPTRSLSVSMTPAHDDTLLLGALATTLTLDRATVRVALDAYTLDAENVSYHCSASAVPAAPLIRLDNQHCAWSLVGLLTEPLFFLTRELKRKYSYEYHTASQVREEIFRQDVYALFSDKRFVKSAGHVELRGTKGTLTTDVDALIFDRKTGALALFELKSQDPFAYSRQERVRQRDYFYDASKQVTASTEWVKRNGVNALLGRLDPKQVKRLKAQNVYVFVLGRYLAHFFDGPDFDQRAAWGTWPQVLRLVHGKVFGADDANPMQSLFNKLGKDTPLTLADKFLPMQEVALGNRYIRVYTSFEMYRNSLLK
ncbi:MAG: hypothetical protein NVSMB38_25160 [Ktedonobacteraceae bacterium]